MFLFVSAVTHIEGTHIEGDAQEAPYANVDEVQRLVLLAQGGDHNAFGKLYDLFAKQIYRSLRTLCCSIAETEDVTADTFVKAFASIHRYEAHAGTRFYAWLVTIGLNLARSRRKKTSRRLVLLDAHHQSVPPEPITQPDQTLVEKERAQALHAALSTLGDAEREILCLRYGAGLNASEIAKITDLKSPYVRKICQRGREQLYTLMSEKLGDNS